MRQRHPTEAREGRRTFVQALAIWIGLSCLFAQVSSALRLLPVEGPCCPGHRALVQADSASFGPTIGVPNRQGDDREQCLLCAELGIVALLPPATPELHVPRHDDGGGLLDQDTSPPKTRVYAFAPKTSPPAGLYIHVSQ